MDNYDQSSMPRHDSTYSDPPPSRHYEPPYQAHPGSQNLEPQQPSISNRLSQSYQAYQAYQPQVKQDKYNEDQQYQQFLQWQQFMQFRQTHQTHQTIPVQQPQQPQQVPLPQSSPVGWQNPYITHSDIYPSNVHTLNHPQTPLSPHGYSPDPMPPPPPFPTPNQHVPPPPAPQFSVPRQQPPHTVTPPVFPNPMTSHTAGYQVPPPPPTRSPLPARAQYSPAPDIPSEQRAPVAQDYPAPLFSAPNHSTSSVPTPPLTKSQFSTAAPPAPAPQPFVAQSPAPQSPASLPHQPENLSELRERLESAGIPDETIVAVLLQHASLGNAPISPAGATPAAPEEKERLSESASAPPELPPRLPPRPSLPTSTTSSTSIPQSLISEKIKFNIYLAGTSKRSIHPVNTHHVEPDDSFQHQRSYITNFTAETFQGNKEPQLRIYRKDPQNPNPNAPPQITQCWYHRSEWSQKVEIKDVWRSGSTKWEPELETWKSEAGTCAGQALQWQYDASRGGESLDTYVIRCATMIPRPPKKNSGTAVQAGAQSTGTPVEVEVCRVVIKDGDRARIEIPKVVMMAGKEAEQMEELVCNALVQFFRKRAGWTTKRAMRAVSRVDGMQVNSYLQTTNNALKVVGFFSGNH